MGRIKTKHAKRKTRELLKLRGDSFSPNFNQNKLVLGKNAVIVSKKLRNIIAGYMSRLKRKEQ